jgi:hypothetical protein
MGRSDTNPGEQGEDAVADTIAPAHAERPHGPGIIVRGIIWRSIGHGCSFVGTRVMRARYPWRPPAAVWMNTAVTSSAVDNVSTYPSIGFSALLSGFSHAA